MKEETTILKKGFLNRNIDKDYLKTRKTVKELGIKASDWECPKCGNCLTVFLDLNKNKTKPIFIVACEYKGCNYKAIDGNVII